MLYFDGDRYDLHGWVVMPNHVHVLITPAARHRLADIMHCWKSYTSKRANRILGRSGAFWQDDYFDRFMRDEAHFLRTQDYIAENPIRAGLCRYADMRSSGSCLTAGNRRARRPPPNAATAGASAEPTGTAARR